MFIARAGSENQAALPRRHFLGHNRESRAEIHPRSA